VSTEAALRLRDRVARDLGLHFDDTKLGFLEELASRNAGARSAERWVEALGPKDLEKLVPDLTVTETYFFRNTDQLEAFVHVASRKSSARIACAGCASGEEPFTLSILARERPELAGTRLNIVAVDLNAAMLERAAQSRYTSWALRETPANVRDRWFRPNGSGFVLDPAIRNDVRFEPRNLSEPNDDLWRPDTFDVVLCRNVIMYFTIEAATRLIASIARALVPGGFLFLGHAENLRGLSHAFHLRHTHGTFYYERRGGEEHRPVPAPMPQPEVMPMTDVSWVETIRGASERIRSLQAHSNRTEPAKPAWELAHAVDLMRSEQYGKAREALDDLPPEAVSDPDVLLLRAVVLMHGGDLPMAEKVSSQLLTIDDLNAGAHYVVALCREASGDRQAAVEQDRLAIHLDPHFAMPRLHLGLLARRAGAVDEARADLERALVLLEQEDPSRLLLFGGGFSREALLRLCKSEIARCGGGG
jgi:chemotaxis protein methyltransferase CheR